MPSVHSCRRREPELLNAHEFVAILIRICCEELCVLVSRFEIISKSVFFEIQEVTDRNTQPWGDRGIGSLKLAGPSTGLFLVIRGKKSRSIPSNDVPRSPMVRIYDSHS